MREPGTYSALVLAYIGDAVYELYTRQKVLFDNPNMPAYRLHRKNINYVNAKAQSEAMEVIEPLLTEEEHAIYKRGRNAKSATVPKNANLIDYRRATGFETLLGYLHLSGKHDRLSELMEAAFDNLDTNFNQEEETHGKK